MRLAIDVMGGDDAPDAILKGCIEALERLSPDDQLILVGPADLIEDALHEYGVSDDRLIVEHAPDVIHMHDKPVDAVRKKQDSSMVRMALRGSRKADDPVDAVLSAGNTGACVSAATMHMKRLRGAHRPGIAVTLPTFGGPCVLCDAGANPEPRPLHLAQYGVMAEAYASHVHGIERPRVAQMNIGSEETKGTGMIQQVRELLEKTPGMNYVGFIEGRDIMEGVADVVVTDGFVGNIVLKLAEGMAKSLFTAIAREVMEADPNLALQFQGVMADFFKKKDYHEYGGAPLLGVNGVCVVCHGSSKPKTIANAILATREHVNANVNEAIMRRLEEIAPVVDPGATQVPTKEIA